MLCSCAALPAWLAAENNSTTPWRCCNMLPGERLVYCYLPGRSAFVVGCWVRHQHTDAANAHTSCRRCFDDSPTWQTAHNTPKAFGSGLQPPFSCLCAGVACRFPPTHGNPPPHLTWHLDLYPAMMAPRVCPPRMLPVVPALYLQHVGARMSHHLEKLVTSSMGVTVSRPASFPQMNYQC